MIDVPISGGIASGGTDTEPKPTNSGGGGGGSSGGAVETTSTSGGSSDSPYGTPRLGNIPSPTFDPQNPLDNVTTDAPDGVDLDAGTTIPEATGNTGTAPNNDVTNQPANPGPATPSVDLPVGPIAAVVAVLVGVVAIATGD